MSMIWINSLGGTVFGFLIGCLLRRNQIRDLKDRNEAFRVELIARMKSGQRRA